MHPARLAAALVLTVLLLFPHVAGQTEQIPPGTPLETVQRPLALVPGADIADVRPLSGFGATNMSVQIRCGALSPNAATAVTLAVTANPPWLSVTVTPPSLEFPANAPDQAAPTNTPCPPTEKRVQEIAVFVSATGEAPAYTPGEIQITASTTTAAGAATAVGFLNATAGAFTAIDASADKSNGVAEPSAPFTYAITITNRGNAKAAIAFSTFAASGIQVDATGGEVGSRQAGDASNQATFDVRVTPDASVINGEYPVWVNATATVPGKPAVRAAQQSTQIKVIVSGAAMPAEEDGDNPLPVAVYAAPLALGIGAFVGRRRVP